MDRDLLTRCGIALYGREWISPLARALGVSLRTMHRWKAGTHAPIDPEAWPRIKGELKPMLLARWVELGSDRDRIIELIQAL